MTWTQEQLERLNNTRLFYLEWIADIEAGQDPLVTRRIAGNVVDDQGEALERYRRNVGELEAILGESGVEFET